jgi:hypothetical protein
MPPSDENSRPAERVLGYAAEMVGRIGRVLVPDPCPSERDGYPHARHGTGRHQIVGTGREGVGRWLEQEGGALLGPEVAARAEFAAPAEQRGAW